MLYSSYFPNHRPHTLRAYRPSRRTDTVPVHLIGWRKASAATTEAMNTRAVFMALHHSVHDVCAMSERACTSKFGKGRRGEELGRSTHLETNLYDHYRSPCDIVHQIALISPRTWKYRCIYEDLKYARKSWSVFCGRADANRCCSNEAGQRTHLLSRLI